MSITFNNNETNSATEMAQRRFLQILHYSREREIALEEAYEFLISDGWDSRAKEYIYNTLLAVDRFVLAIEFDFDEKLFFSRDKCEMAQNTGLRTFGFTNEEEKDISKINEFLTNPKYSSEAKESVYNNLSARDKFALSLGYNIDANLDFLRNNREKARNPGLRSFGFTNEEENNLREIYSFLADLNVKQRAKEIIDSTLSERDRRGIDILKRQKKLKEEVGNVPQKYQNPYSPTGTSTLINKNTMQGQSRGGRGRC